MKKALCKAKCVVRAQIRIIRSALRAGQCEPEGHAQQITDQAEHEYRGGEALKPEIGALRQRAQRQNPDCDEDERIWLADPRPARPGSKVDGRQHSRNDREPQSRPTPQC